MIWPRTALAAGLAALSWVGCSHDSSGPDGPGEPIDEEIILSDPVAPGAVPAIAGMYGGAAPVSFVSLPPGTLSGDAEAVIIRNVTAGDEIGVAVAVVDGGFDPVAMRGEAGDRLELEIHDGETVLGRKYGAVPTRRPPSIVRVAPPPGRTDVALAVRPTIIFSEPVDPATLGEAIRLLASEAEVLGQAGARPGEPWVVEFIPTALLESGATYELDVATTVRDLDGDALAAPARYSFTTGTVAPPPPPPPGPAPTGRIAFMSTRHGGPWIYLANADGSGVTALTSGEAPAWSLDGEMIAFNRGGQLLVINADGSGERLLVNDAYRPSWSPDGSQLAYYTSARGGWSIHVVNVDGSGDEVLLTPADLGPDYLLLAWPAWSPDGRSIAFAAHWYPDDGVPEAWVMDADGSNPRMIEGTGPGGDPYAANARFPSWSPDGTSLVFSSRRFLGPSFAELVASRRVDGTGELTVHYASNPFGWMPNPVGDLDWSPDGQSIAYERWSATSAFPHRIHVVNTQTGLTAQLVPETTGSGIVQPYYDSDIAWSRVSP